jgi:hypothetical protein
MIEWEKATKNSQLEEDQKEREDEKTWEAESRWQREEDRAWKKISNAQWTPTVISAYGQRLQNLCKFRKHLPENIYQAPFLHCLPKICRNN